MTGRSVCLKQRGVSLVELIAFIVVVSVAAIGLFGSFRSILGRGNINAADITQAGQLAQERMELIMGQRQIRGYSSTSLDPCPGAAAICTPLTGFNVSSAGANTLIGWPTAGNSNNERAFTVTVTNTSGATLAQQSSVFGNY